MAEGPSYGSRGCKRPGFLAQVPCCLVCSMFRWEGARAESLRSRGCQGTGLLGPGAWKSQFLSWRWRRLGQHTMRSWGLDSRVHECLVPSGEPGGRPPGWKGCTFRPGCVRAGVPRSGPFPSPTPQDPAGPHLGRTGAPTGQVPDGELRAQEQQQQRQQRRRRRRAQAAARTARGGAGVPHVWALAPSSPWHSRPARPGPSGDKSSRRRRRRRLPPPPGCAGAASPAPHGPRLLVRTIARRPRAEGSRSRNAGGGRRQAPAP